MTPLLEALIGSFFAGVCIRITASLVADAVLDRNGRR